MTLVLRWIAVDPDIVDRSMQGLLSANRARNWSEFRAACALGVAPSFGSVYADVDGNIGYQVRPPFSTNGSASQLGTAIRHVMLC